VGKVFWITDRQGQLLYISPSYEEIWRRSVEQLYQNSQDWLAAVHPEDRDRITLISQSFHEFQEDFEYRVIWPNGEVRWIRDRAFPVCNEQGEFYRIAGIAEDVTERKRTEQFLRQQASGESLLKQVAFQTRSSLNLDYILNTSIDRVQEFLQADRVLIYRFESDIQGRIAVESVSQPEFSILGRHLEDPCFTRAVAERYQQGYGRTISDIQAEDLPTCYVEFLNQLQVRAVLVVPVLQNDHHWGLLIAHHCTTPRQWQLFELDLLKQFADLISIAIQQTDLYAQIESQLKQKEVLLKEVHHRVKNNLQVISAMLKLQARTTNDPVILDALEDSRSRLRAIALIHEILYQNNNLERLEFHHYIQNLTNTILATYSSSNRIRPVYQLQPIQLNLETAIPCGLLLNELVTNAIKHAFPQGREGEIRITLNVESASNMHDSNFLRSEAIEQPVSPIAVPGVKKFCEQPDCRYILTIEDTGIGMPADFNIRQLKSLGLKIAYDLAVQLQGTLQLDRTGGARFKLSFSELKYHKRL
jgi:PAS domain S-box-containing protein